VFGILISTGCYSTDPNGDQPIRYASGVQIAPYDSILRKPSQNIEIFQDASEVKRRYHIIALLTREAYPRDEALITSALIWRAKHIGANGIIFLYANFNTGQKSSLVGNRNVVIGGSEHEQAVFRANAIVFDE